MSSIFEKGSTAMLRKIQISRIRADTAAGNSNLRALARTSRREIQISHYCTGVAVVLYLRMAAQYVTPFGSCAVAPKFEFLARLHAQ